MRVKKKTTCQLPPQAQKQHTTSPAAVQPSRCQILLFIFFKEKNSLFSRYRPVGHFLNFLDYLFFSKLGSGISSAASPIKPFLRKSLLGQANLKFFVQKLSACVTFDFYVEFD